MKVNELLTKEQYNSYILLHFVDILISKSVCSKKAKLLSERFGSVCKYAKN